MKHQAFEICEGLAYKNDKIWLRGQIGFEMCVFRFDLRNYVYLGNPDTFDHFSPLNLNGRADVDLDAIDIKHITLSTGPTTDVTHVIQW